MFDKWKKLERHKQAVLGDQLKQESNQIQTMFGAVYEGCI